MGIGREIKDMREEDYVTELLHRRVHTTFSGQHVHVYIDIISCVYVLEQSHSVYVHVLDLENTSGSISAMYGG